MKLAGAFAGLILSLTGCNSVTTPKLDYIESQPSFFELRHGDWTQNQWIRKPENLWRVHETFKKLGYNKLLGTFLMDEPVIFYGIYINKKGQNLLDSLLLTYPAKEHTPKYYKEFWGRRKKEETDSIVYIVLKEIQQSNGPAALDVVNDDTKVNDTLLELLRIEFDAGPLNEVTALQHFETLKRLGFHESAFNLLYERYAYYNVKWNRDSLVKTLTPSRKAVYPWFPDDTK